MIPPFDLLIFATACLLKTIINIMKTFAFALAICMGLLAHAQIPAGYYTNATGTGYTLKTQLHNIIDDHDDQGYSAVWDFIYDYELDTYYENDGSVLDIYSENPSGTDPYNFTKGTDQCGNYSGEGSCYNREHSFPKSWFDDASPMFSDVHHLFPTDGYVNGQRGNFPFGEVGSASFTSENGCKKGSARSGLGYSGTVFEPIDEFKGDLARAYFYMATRYEDVLGSWSSDMLDGSTDQVFETWALDMLMDWHSNDPVSQKELDRNDNIYIFQGNRNPFVDHPEWVDEIWGDGSGTSPDIDVTAVGTLNFGEVAAGQSSTSQSYMVSGSDLEGNISVSVASPFQLSLNNSTWSSAVTVTQANAESGGQTVYVRFSPTIENGLVYNQNISHTSSGATAVNVSVTGTEYTLTIDDISGVRAGTNGQEFTIVGIVTTPDYGSSNGQYFVQDATGGINIYHEGNHGLVSYGDEVQITGTRATFNDLIELEPSAISILSSGNTVPDHEVIDESDISTSSSYLGQLVKVGGVTLDDAMQWPTTSSSSGTNVNATVGTTGFVIRIDDASFYDGTPAPSGTLIVSGILTQFSGAVQIMPFFDGDVIESEDNPPVLSASQPSIDFPDTEENTVSSSASLNISGSDLTENVSVSLSGEFEMSTSEGGSYSSSLDLSLNDGGIDQDIFVRFIPTSAGEKAGTLTFTSSGEEETVNLTGTATPEVIPDPELNLSASSIDFGEVAFGSFGDDSYTVSASNLTSNLIIIPPNQVTLSQSAAFDGTVYSNSSPLTLLQDEGTVELTTIFVRYTPAADDESTLSGTILHASTGIDESITVSGSELEEVVAPKAWISEFHYDNEGQDQGEFVEIYVANASDFDLSLFTIELVEQDESVYSSFLASTMTTLSDDYFYRNFGGLKDGPNGIRLLYGTDVVDFISYEAAISGAELIPVEEGESTPLGTSLQLCCNETEKEDMAWLAAIATPGFPNEDVALGMESTSIRVYPNPVKDRIHLKTNRANISLQLIDLSGRELVNLTGNIRDVEKSLNGKINRLESGIYVLKIIEQQSTQTIRLKVVR
ncbi:MAG: endonuclease [Ekhidna sp.]|uniref:endonuclease n=1 Tax=Ekhidna sp. TaxID=2608089 RepID=UPI0032EC59F5